METKSLQELQEAQRKEFDAEWEKSNDWGGGKFGSLDEMGTIDDTIIEFRPNVDGIKAFLTTSTRAAFLLAVEMMEEKIGQKKNERSRVPEPVRQYHHGWNVHREEMLKVLATLKETADTSLVDNK